MLNGQLSTGLVQVVTPGSGELLGYAFTEANDKGQLQRWLLYRDPDNSFELVSASADKASWTLADWRANVPSLWRKGAFYVWAQTTIYEYGRSYETTQEDGTAMSVVWHRIPNPPPAPTYPPEGDVFQLDPTGYHVINVLQWVTGEWGMAFTVNGLCDAMSAAQGQARNAEYWYLPPAFQPAGASGRTSISVGTGVARSLDEFIALSNERWAPGSSFAITGCCNHFGDVPPASP